MTDTELNANETKAGIVFRLHVQPRAKRCEVAGVHDGALKVKVTAPPVEDAANRAVIEFLSRSLGVSKASLQILAGGKSRDKVLQISGLSLADFRAKISCHLYR
jgi:uncharacterized protein (TIGR00251 family)